MAYYDQWFRVRPLSKGLYKQLKAFEKEHGVGDDQVVHFALVSLFASLSDHPDNQNAPECKARDLAAIKAFRPGQEGERAPATPASKEKEWTPQEWVKAGKTGPPPGYVETVYDGKVVWVLSGLE